MVNTETCTEEELDALMLESGLWIFGVRSLHEDEQVAVGDTMAASYVWEDGDRSEECIGGTCCFVADEDQHGWSVATAIERAESYCLSGRYALLGGKYCGNNDLIAEAFTCAIRDAVVLAIW